MSWKPWQVWSALAWGVVVLVTLGLAAVGAIPWVTVSIVTVLSGCVTTVAWWADRRVQRRLLERRPVGESTGRQGR